MILNPWFALAASLLAVWVLIWLVKPKLRKEMFWVSIFTLPLGLTEPFFVPEYWSPPSLFNLAATTGFDIESFIFAFSMGGIASVIYEIFINAKHKKMTKKEISKEKRTSHLLALMSPVIIFIILYLFTKINPIHSVIISLFAGGITTMICRKDLWKNSLMGASYFPCFIFYPFY